MSAKLILPYGDKLRDFLNDSGVTKSDVRALLRKRGLFTADDEKSTTTPLVVSTGVAPAEFKELIDNIRVKEENLKSHTQSVRCIEGSVDLIQAVPINFDVKKIAKKPFSNYSVIGVPSFKKINGDGNDIELCFSVERTDYTQSFSRKTQKFQGKVRFKKDKEKLDISIGLSHTSPETKEVATKISKEFISSLKEKNVISEGEKLLEFGLVTLPMRGA